MPLIVDTFETPALLISQELFRSTDIVEVKDMSRESIQRILSDDKVYYVHRECVGDMQRLMKYYFNEVIEVIGNVRYINKSKKIVRYYLIGRNEDGIAERLSEMKGAEEESNSIDKTAFLPHLRAQEEEIVIFPDDED